MPKMFFLNLPVEDVARARRFHETMGAVADARFCDERTAAMVYSDAVVVMLLDRSRFADFTSKEIIDAKRQVEGLFCFSAESRAEVDEVIGRVAEAGGRADPCPLQDHGFMYGRSYEDPDGHIFELVWMDQAALADMQSATA